MKDTYIFLDDDFCTTSIFRSWTAEDKLANWELWAEYNLSEKDKKEIIRAVGKL